MKKATLKIETRDQMTSVDVEDEVSIGRTDSAQIVLGDLGLSRINTTFFRDGDQLLVVDEKSLNGTFLNGERLGNKPVRVLDGDRLKLGTETHITVEIANEQRRTTPTEKPETANVPVSAPAKTQVKNPAGAPPKKPPLILIGSVAASFLIIFLALITILLLRVFRDPGGTSTSSGQQTVSASKKIPRRVIDPLGGGDAEDIDDLMSYWDVQEEELNTADVGAITSESSVAKINLNVSLDFFKKQMERSKANRGAPTGNDPPGSIVPPELRNSIAKQTAKIREIFFVIPRS